MRVSSDRFASVINYLSGFGDHDSVIQFAPLGKLVVASIAGPVAYAEFVFEPSVPLESRWCCRHDTLKRIAAVIGDDDVVYSEGSRASISCGGARWWLGYGDLMSIAESPEVNAAATIKMEGSAIDCLSMMRAVVAQSDDSGVLDCVLLETKESQEGGDGRRVWVACDRVAMAIVEQRGVDCQASEKLLIEGRMIPYWMSTCESGSAIEVRIGVNHYSVQCGRRFATFPVRSGVYPKSWPRIWSIAKSMNDVNSNRFVVAKSAMSEAIRQCLGGSRVLSLSTDIRGMVISSVSESGEFCESEVAIRDEGESHNKVGFGPVLVKGSYVRRVVDLWGSGSVEAFNASRESPVVLRDSTTSVIIQPVVRD